MVPECKTLGVDRWVEGHLRQAEDFEITLDLGENSRYGLGWERNMEAGWEETLRHSSQKHLRALALSPCAERHQKTLYLLTG